MWLTQLLDWSHFYTALFIPRQINRIGATSADGVFRSDMLESGRTEGSSLCALPRGNPCNVGEQYESQKRTYRLKWERPRSGGEGWTVRTWNAHCHCRASHFLHESPSAGIANALAMVRELL